VVQCLIGIGSNVGDRAAIIRQAVSALGQQPSIRVVAASQVRSTLAVGGQGQQPDFLNAAALVETDLRPEALLRALQQTELQFGRARIHRWAPRTLDLDLLLYGRESLVTGQLVVPHPRMAFRRFVLEPAAEIAGDMVHPDMGWTIRQLLHHLDTADDYVAVTGPPGVGKTQVATRAAEAVQGRLVTMAVPLARAAAATDDRTGFAGPSELESLRLRTDGIRRCGSMPGQTVVSDYWLGQVLVYARGTLNDLDYAELERCWRDLQGAVLQPRLLVFLDPLPVTWEDRHIATQFDPVVLGLREALFDQATQLRQAPLLRLSAADLDWALVEVIAAINAMRKHSI